MKAVVFDFDGTLTKESKNIWHMLWQDCSYSIDQDSLCAKLFRSFLNGEITHEERCNLSVDAYKRRNLNINQFISHKREFELIDGFDETIELLRGLGLSLHIVSGNDTNMIKSVLGDRVKYFDSITANEFTFDGNGLINGFVSKNYDFEGKARFIKEFSKKNNIDVKDIWFVGNGINDEFVRSSGCNTLCINPDNTDPNNKDAWTRGIEVVKNLTQIIPEIFMEKNSLVNC